MSLNAGHFSRTIYDTCAYPDDLTQSTAPYTYITNTDRIFNCNGCLTTFGPRSGLNGAGVSSATGNVVAAAQENIDIDSVLSNRNVPLSRCKRGKVNPINITKIRTKNLPICNDYLDLQHTRMTYPAMFYRGAAIDRFYDLNKDPQANIFWDWAVNTRLEAKDNFVPDLPRPLTDWGFGGDADWSPCAIALDANGSCGTDCSQRCERKLRMNPNRSANILNERRARGRGVNVNI